MRNRAAERGQVLPFVALALTLLFGFAALVVDAGYLQYRQRVQQTAADAAAIAGGYSLLNGNRPDTSGAAAAATNGFTSNGTTATVSVTSPPASGPNAGSTSAVEATITVSYPALFSAVLGRSQNSVSTRAVAVVQNNPTGPCIYVLAGNMNFNDGTVTGPCGALVNNDVQGNKNTTWNIPSIGAGGHITGNPPASVDATTGIPPIQDPCVHIAGCKALAAMYPLDSNVANEGVYKGQTCLNDPGTGHQLTPACYKSLSGSYTVTAPGLYVVNGDFTGSLTCTGCGPAEGVTVVISGKVNLNGSTTNLTAPPAVQGVSTTTVTNQGAAGIVLYQAKTETAPENFSAQQLNGVVYAPAAHINQNASSSLNVGTLIVAEFVSNKNTITLTDPPNKNPVQSVVLSE